MIARSLECRLRRIEDRNEIADLQARYTLAIDLHDLATVAPLFATEGRFRSADEVMDATGRDAICAQYRTRFAVLGFAFHVTHDHLIELDPVDPDRASGTVSSHAEVVRNGQPMLVAMRYADRYCREDGAWRFADRLLRFLYYLPLADYAQAIATRDRMRAYGDARPADLPEGAATFGANKKDDDA